ARQEQRLGGPVGFGRGPDSRAADCPGHPCEVHR
ncbi:hypothetical protein HaLaN_00604, partial [Haematococcus lacustris]